MTGATLTHDEQLERERLGKVARNAESRYYADTEPCDYTPYGDYQAVAWAVRADVLTAAALPSPAVLAAIERVLALHIGTMDVLRIHRAPHIEADIAAIRAYLDAIEGE